MDRVYLGDGVYAEFTGYDIRLWTVRSEGQTHEIFLGNEEINELNRFVETIKKYDTTT